MALGVVFRRSAKVPSKPTKSRRKLKYYVGRLSKAMEAKLDRDRKQNKRCSTVMIFVHVKYGHDGTSQIKKDTWTVELPQDKRTWNEATADEIELAILLIIHPMPDSFEWHECRLYAQSFINEASLLPLVTNEANPGLTERDSSSEDEDPYLPLTAQRSNSIDNTLQCTPKNVPLFMPPAAPRVVSIKVPLKQQASLNNQCSPNSGICDSSIDIDPHQTFLSRPRQDISQMPEIINATNTYNGVDQSRKTSDSNKLPRTNENTVDLVSEDSNDDIIYEGTFSSEQPPSFFRRKAIEFQHAVVSENIRKKSPKIDLDCSDSMKVKSKKLQPGQSTLETFFPPRRP